MQRSDRTFALFRWALVGAALSLYAATVSGNYVGHFGDDARDILAAQSILQGGYRDLQLPGHPPATFPLPGFPAFLALLLAVFRLPLSALPVVSLSLMGVAGILADRLCGERFSGFNRVLILALFLFNPITIFLANSVVADSLYVVLLLGAIQLVQAVVQKDSLPIRAALLATLSAAALVRPEGPLLGLAATGAFIYAGRRPLAVLSFLFSMGAWSMFALRTLLLSAPSPGYGAIWMDALRYFASGPMAFPLHALQLARGLVWELLIPSPWAVPMTPLVIIATLSLVGGLGVALHRVSRRANAEGIERGLPVTLALCYTLLHGTLHLLWPAPDVHYLWPLLPFLLMIALHFCAEISQRQWRIVLQVAAGLVLVLYGVHAIAAVQMARRPPATNRLPARTLALVREKTPSDAWILSPEAAVITLYTQRHTLTLLGAHNPDDFFAQLLEKGITHIELAPIGFLYVNSAPARLWKAIEKAVTTSPERFAAIAVVPEEGRALYAVRTLK